MIGIMSDSHDNRTAIKQAVRLFKASQCSLVIHAGDFVAPFAAGELQSLDCPVHAVFGNCDGEKLGLKKIFKDLGDIREAPFIFKYQQLDILLTHVHFNIEEYIRLHNPDVLVYGHTHRPKIHKKKQTLLINPGETGGWVTGKSTVALLDTKIMQADIINLD